jgi:opacity protein-like surface antigen
MGAALGTGAVWAQEEGKTPSVEGGGPDDGEEEEGGKGMGRIIATPAPVAPIVSETASAPLTVPDRTLPERSYFRVELGAARASAGNASWLPPGYPNDPKVFFDLNSDTAAFGAVALGHSFGSGWRAEAALNMFGSADFLGPWSYTVPDTPGPHADMAGSTRSVALLFNGYYDFETDRKLTPFVTAGVGVAHNMMGDWTRINPDSDRTTRSFTGGSETDLAWTVGLGMAVDVGPIIGSAPAKIELSWRYFNLGSVSGGAVPLAGSGSKGEPVSPLNFDLGAQVISLALRIPF